MVLFLAGGSFELVSAIVMAQWENSPCPVANCVCWFGFVLGSSPVSLVVRATSAKPEEKNWQHVPQRGSQAPGNSRSHCSPATATSIRAWKTPASGCRLSCSTITAIFSGACQILFVLVRCRSGLVARIFEVVSHAAEHCRQVLWFFCWAPALLVFVSCSEATKRNSGWRNCVCSASVCFFSLFCFFEYLGNPIGLLQAECNLSIHCQCICCKFHCLLVKQGTRIATAPGHFGYPGSPFPEYAVWPRHSPVCSMRCRVSSPGPGDGGAAFIHWALPAPLLVKQGPCHQSIAAASRGTKITVLPENAFWLLPRHPPCMATVTASAWPSPCAVSGSNEVRKYVSCGMSNCSGRRHQETFKDQRHSIL